MTRSSAVVTSADALAGDDDRLSDAHVCRSGGAGSASSCLRDRSLRSARRSVERRRDRRALSRRMAIGRRRAEGRRRAAGRMRSLAVGDRPTVMAAYLSRLLGLPGHPPEAAARRARQAADAREAEGARACRRRRSSPCRSAADAMSLLDRAVVPGRRQADRAVGQPRRHSRRRSAEFRDGVRSACAACWRRPRSASCAIPKPDVIQIEEYIPGAEYALEGILENGVLRTLAIFDKPDPLDGPFFEETIYVTPSRARPGDAAADRARRSPPRRRRSGCITVRFTPSAASTPRRVRARSRGAADRRAVREGAALRSAAGDLDRLRGVPAAPRARRADRRLDAGAARVGGDDDSDSAQRRLSARRRRRRRRARCRTSRRSQITAKPDQQLLALPEGASYLGFIFARARRAGVAERAVREAHARLRFTIDPLICEVVKPVVSSYLFVCCGT